VDTHLKLFVIGATGRTGQEVVQQALARGHRVTAFVRSPENIDLKNERLTVLKGDVMDENFVTRCKITTQSFRHWAHERFSSRAQCSMTAQSQLRVQ
jgi:putative NADH-flavin reductase